MISRRFVVRLAAFIPGAGLLATAAKAQTAPGKQRVAYHLADKEKADFVLGNIKNHVDAVGVDKVEIVLVAHGPGLKGLHALDGDQATIGKLQSLMKQGVVFNACGNTLKNLKYDLSDFPPGTIKVDQGGVVRLAELQQQGYAYLRP